jgi:HEAT repeat protein
MVKLHARWLVAAALLGAAVDARHALAQLDPYGLPGSGLGQGQTRNRDKLTSGKSEIDEYGRDLQDKDPVRRLEAVKELSGQKDDKAIAFLIEAVSDEDVRVRLKAIDCLGKARASAATPILIQSLYLRETAPWMKQRILVALGQIGDNRAANSISDLLSHEGDPTTLGTAIFALGEIGDPAVVDRLKQIQTETTNDRVRLLSQDAITKIERKRINPKIELRALRNDEEGARPAAASAAPPLAY